MLITNMNGFRPIRFTFQQIKGFKMMICAKQLGFLAKEILTGQSWSYF